MKQLRSGIFVPDDCPDWDGRAPSLVLVHFELQAVDKDGKPLAPPYRQWSRSWVKNEAVYYKDYLRNIGEENGITLRSGATATLVVSNGPPWQVNGPIANANYGIILGTGTTTESKTDSNLAASIAEGSGAGQLNHLVTSIYSPLTDITGGWRVIVDRQFNNNSGGSIVVGEIGLAKLVAGTTYALVLRDVLASTYTIANGASAVGRYKIDFLV